MPFFIVDSIHGDPGGRYANCEEALAVVEGMVRDEIARPGEFSVVEVDDQGDVVGEPFRPSGHALGSLTARQHDVLRLLTEGMSNGEIAAELGITQTTVKVHLRHIREKLRASSATLRGERPRVEVR
jgi:DNA-binding NarL/FixJ family response regulator